ncbi:MAG: 2-hydroxyacid dehydrogenase [Roseibium sp.]|uniref:2-hydroxyacid dehydrogenase n=1 Tax=Roseibium sp. TaxID=1936156 RepID=UPI003D9C6253
MIQLVILDPVSEDRLERFAGYLPEGWNLENAASRAREDQFAALEGTDFAITADVPVTADMMAVPGLRAIHKWGVGYDNIDCEAAKAHGVRVLRTTGSNALSVAESALGLILALNRNLVRGHTAVLAGRWPKSELGTTSQRLSGKTVGIIGLGYVGKALAGLLRGFGCDILYTGRTRLDAEAEAALDVRFASLEELLARADVVSLNCSLNEDTRAMINARTLALMKRGALLVNVARGGIVVEADLAEALKSGHLRGAASDVYMEEPVTADNPLLGLETAVNTPHIAAVSADTFEPTVTRMIRNLRALDEGREPPDLDVLV